MALINCPECENEVSDQAHACPNCGYPIQDINAEERDEDKEKEEQYEYFISESNQNDKTESKEESESNGGSVSNGKGCLKGCLQVLLILFGLIIIAGVVGNYTDQDGNDSSNRNNRDTQKITAVNMCQKFLKDRLHAPSTAEFPWSPDSTKRISDDHWIVKSHVDAQNKFGAQLRKKFECEVKNTSGKEWKLIDLNIY